MLVRALMNRPKRPLIAIDARYVRERPSGIGAMVAELTRRAPIAMPEADFLFLVHPRARRPLCPAKNVREIVVTAEANGPATLGMMPVLVDLERVSLFHAPYNILPFHLTMKTVVTVHDVMWLTHPRLCRSAGVWGELETAFYKTGIRHALENASAILAVSQATRDAIASIDPAAASRTTITPHGLSEGHSPARTQGDRDVIAQVQRRWIPGARRFVLCVGQATGYKNHDAVVTSFAKAFRDEPETHLVMLQRLGSNATHLLELARTEGVDGQVHVLASVPFDDLIALYRGALCLCHPSLVEGWGMPVSEALACGCPVITSDVSSMPEVAGGAAELVDPESTTSIANALRRVADSETLRASMRQRGLDRASQLSWENHVQRTVNVYRALL